MIIYALGIHSGGGKVLLDYLLSSHFFDDVNILICDSRYIVPDKLAFKISIIYVEPNLICRWLAEIKLKNLSKKNPNLKIFCFSNMPPALRLHNKTILFFQNALLLPGIDFKLKSFKTRLRLKYEQLWIKLFIHNIDEIWIQSVWMKKFFFKTNASILVNPFLPKLPEHKIQNKKYQFICVTGTAEHKQLAKLISEWPKEYNSNFSLIVVCDSPGPNSLDYFNIKNPNIFFKFNVDRSELFDLYQQSVILINTSLIESFCLPIYEANYFGLKVVALDVLFTKEIDFIDLRLKELTEIEIRNAIKLLAVL